MAVQYGEGRVKPDGILVSRSVFGGEFTTDFMAETTVRAHIGNAKQEIGFTLSDTWRG